MTEENPYEKLDNAALTKHAEQLSVIVKEKKVDVTQMFGEPASISVDDQNKIDQFESLTSKVNKLSEEVGKSNLTDTEAQLAKQNLDRLVGDIGVIDTSAPIAAFVDSKYNNLQKYEILSDVVPLVKHYVDQIATLKKGIGEGNKDENTQTGTQTFAEPEATSDAADKLIEGIMNTYGKED